jgi:hypothetical protein
MGPVKEHPRASDRLWWCARRPDSQFQTFCPGLPSSCDSADAARNVREALAIYQRIGVPEARLVQDTLEEHGL